MTGYTVHTGSTKKFSSGWDRIFSGDKSGESGAPALPSGSRSAKKSASKKPAKKTASAGKAKAQAAQSAKKKAAKKKR